jgi:hypothetical protein
MAREFDPNNPNRTDYPAGEPINDPLVSEPRSNMGLIGALAALAVAVVLGLVFWSNSGPDTTASNTSPGVTTGSSTASPPARPDAEKDANKTDTR